MEVHHAHHPSHKKKWGEYVLEFFMLFIAVTMGFFAENIREQHVLNEKKQENLHSLIEDLRQDSISISITSNETKHGIQYLSELQNELYLFHAHKIDKTTFLNSIRQRVFDQYNYYTFFLNGSTYKNMLSTGLISRIESPELKKKITFYYEAMAERLKINNGLVDQTAENYYHRYFPFSNTAIIKLRKALGDTTSINMANTNTYLDFYFHQKIIEDKLTDPELILQTDAILMRVMDYSLILNNCKEQNAYLIDKLKIENKD